MNSAYSDLSAASASDFTIGRLTSLLHSALDELNHIRPALAELKELKAWAAWQQNIQSKLDTVLKWQEDALL